MLLKDNTDCYCWQGLSDEKSKTSPWTLIAKYKLMVEEELAKLDGYETKYSLNEYVIVNFSLYEKTVSHWFMHCHLVLD